MADATAQLIEAVRRRDDDAVRAALGAGADANAEVRGASALLIALGVEAYGDSQLLAMAPPRLGIVKALLAAGADAGYQPPDGPGVFACACEAGSTVVVECVHRAILEKTGRDPIAGRPLVDMILNAAPEKALFFLRHGADVNAPDARLGWTALHRAVVANDLRLVRVLLAWGADPGMSDRNGRRPVDCVDRAAFEKAAASLRRALASGWDREAVFRAVSADDAPAITGSQCDPDAFDRDGTSLLVHAAKLGNIAATRALLDLGADPDLADTVHFTALMRAAEGGHSDLALLLIDRGANPWARAGADGPSAAEIADRCAHPDTRHAILGRANR